MYDIDVFLLSFFDDHYDGKRNKKIGMMSAIKGGHLMKYSYFSWCQEVT